MKVDLKGCVALVTGAARGIGRATALALADNGAVIAVNDREGGESTCEEIGKGGGRASFYHADVSCVAEVDSMVAAVERDLGPIGLLVNNAGVNIGADRRPAHEFLDSEWHRIIRVDLDGVFYCSRAVAKRMVERRRGAIINISSVFGIVPARLQCAFTAAKAGVVNFTRSQALELGPYGIRVNAVAPGSILTEGTKSLFYNPETKQKADSLLSHVPLGRPGTTEDIAAAVLYLASPDAQYVTGHVLVVDGGWTAGFSRDW
jgi:NAD(P)-dependent dehydrogenase (short-subunit alcohol dehydrogenase family)